MRWMKAGKVLHIILAVLIAIFLTGHFLLNNKKIQQKAAVHVVKIAKSALGTDVSAGRVQLVYPIGISIDDLTVYDLRNDTLAHFASATFRLKSLQLLNNKICVSSVRLQSPDIRLRQDSIGAVPNYQFLTQLGGNSTKTEMSFRANSILVRNGSLRYDLASAPQTDGLFNKDHIGIHGLNANLSLKTISSDSLSFIVRKFSLAEQSGFKLLRTKGSVTVGKDFTDLSGLTLALPESNLTINRFVAGIGLKEHPKGIPDMVADIKASLTGRDIMAFVPQASGMSDRIDLTLRGKGNSRMFDLSTLNVNSAGKELSMNADGTILFDHNGKITGFRKTKASGSFSESLPVWLESQLSGVGLSVPSQLRSLGNGTFDATLESGAKNMESAVSLTCDAGTVNCDIKGEDNQYNIALTGQDVNLPAIIDNSDLDNVSLYAQADISKGKDGYSGTFDGNIGSLQYKKYNYQNIKVNGNFAPGSILSDLRFSDSNGALALNAQAKTGPDKSIRLNLDADNLNLSAYNLVTKDSIALSTVVSANLSGKDIDDLTGKITVDNLHFTDSQGDWSMDNLTASIGSINGNNKVISVYSDFMNMSVVGDYKLSTLAGSLTAACNTILPTLGKMITDKTGIKPDDTTPNSFVADARIDKLDFLSAVFHIPVSIDRPAGIQLSMNNAESFTGMITIPGLYVAQERITDALIMLNSADSTCRARISGLYGFEDGVQTDFSASLLAFTDIIRGEYTWSDGTGNNEGYAKSLSQFLEYDSKNGLYSMTLIDSTNVMVKGTKWKFDISDIRTHKGKVTISGLNVRNNLQFLQIDGIASPDSSDVMRISMKNIDLDRLLSTFHVNSMQFKGIASGDIALAGLLGQPTFEGTFDIKGFEFYGSYLGDTRADCRWNRLTERIEITATATDPGQSLTGLSGYYRPSGKFIDMTINAKSTDLSFLNKWTRTIFQDLRGRATGSIRLFGTPHSLDLEGEAILNDGYLVQGAVNSTFIIKQDTLWFEPGKMLFKNVEVADESGHNGLMTCIIYHDHFKDWRVDMRADVNNMLVYNQAKTDKSSIYAKVYAKGSMNLYFNQQNGLSVYVNARTAPGTRFGFQPQSNTVSDYSFLTIVDKNTVNVVEDETAALMLPQKKKNNNKFNINLNIDCTEDALIDLAISSLTGLFRGNGNVSVKFDPKEGIVLNGIYNPSYGQCSLSLEDVIRKDFSLLEGSYVRFNGSPMDTELNLLTYHNVNSVSIYDLDPSASSSNNVRVRCLLGVSGNVSDPKLTFDIDMPSGTSEEKAILASATSTEEQKNLQFMYLLAIGRFYTYDINSGFTDGLATSTMESIVNSTVSGQINNLLSQVLNNESISLSSNVSASSYLNNDATNLSNKELEGILEAHLLNNRLLVNGNFGYRENTINNTSNFIGDFEVKYLLFPKQGISVKGYNKTNDKYFTKANLTTQGVGLVFERDF